MSLKNSIILDFSLDQKYIFILLQERIYNKKIISLKRSENISNIFFNFLKKKRIKINNSYRLYVNLGPGNLIAIRNAVVFAKMLSIIFGCKLLGFSNYQLIKLNKNTGIRKSQKFLLTMGAKSLLLDLSKKKAFKLSENELHKYQSFKFHMVYNKKILKNLVLSKNLVKRVFPISYSDI
tara:strand:- start:512 stop:1048 length:537 start_codon:yes stop_codon:yes gene_type:complete